MVRKKPDGDDVDRKTPFALNWRCGPPTAPRKAKGSHPMNDVNSLSHTSRNCKLFSEHYVDTAGKKAKKIEEYIRHQLDEDKAGEQLTMGNF